MKDWMRDIRPGHKLRPNPLWNNTEPNRQLSVPTTILETKEDSLCHSGLLFKVKFKNGDHGWLDAGCFCEPIFIYPLDAK